MSNKNKTQTSVLPRLMGDLLRRTELGIQKYGGPLTTNNGRSALKDAYEEVLDLAQYLCQKMMEDEQPKPTRFLIVDDKGHILPILFASYTDAERAFGELDEEDNWNICRAEIKILESNE